MKVLGLHARPKAHPNVLHRVGVDVVSCFHSQAKHLPHLRDLRRLGDPEQRADLLMHIEPAPGEVQKLVASRVEAEMVNAAVGGSASRCGTLHTGLRL